MSEPNGRPSLRLAINAMCKECIYDPYDEGRWREQVARCTAPKCPLFGVRPLPRPDHPADVAEKGPNTASTRDFAPSKPSEPTESSTRCERPAEGPVLGTGANVGANGG